MLVELLEAKYGTKSLRQVQGDKIYTKQTYYNELKIEHHLFSIFAKFFRFLQK